MSGGDRSAQRLAIAPAPQTAVTPAADQLAVLQLDQPQHLALPGGGRCAQRLAIAPAPQTPVTPAADQLAVLQLDQAQHLNLPGGDRCAQRLAIAPAPQAAVTPAADQLAVLQLDQAQHLALPGGDGADLVVASRGNSQGLTGGESFYMCLFSQGGEGIHHAAEWVGSQQHFSSSGVLGGSSFPLPPPGDTASGHGQCSEPAEPADHQATNPALPPFLRFDLIAAGLHEAPRVVSELLWPLCKPSLGTLELEAAQ